MAVLRIDRITTAPEGGREMLAGHAAGTAVEDACCGLTEVAPAGRRHPRGRAWPAPPSLQLRHGRGQAPAARRGGEKP